MVRLKLLRDIQTFSSHHEPQFDKDGNPAAPKRYSHKIKGRAGQTRDFPRVDAEKMVVSQQGLPVDDNGDILAAAMKSLGKHEKRLLWEGAIRLTDVERERLRAVYVPPKEGTPALDALLGGVTPPDKDAELKARIAEHAPKSEEEAAENMRKIQENAASRLESEVKPKRKRRTRAQMEADKAKDS